MIVVYPALENVCLVAGQSDKLLTRNDLIPLPIQVRAQVYMNMKMAKLCKIEIKKWRTYFWMRFKAFL